MSERLKLLFDECVGRPILKSLAELLSAGGKQSELAHVLDFQEQGIYDEKWIPQVAKEAWIVVTGDRGKGGRSKGEKLPIICRQFDVTHVMLSARVHEQKTFDKIRILLEVWPEIADLTTALPGSGYSLQLTTGGHAHLKQVYSPEPPAASGDAAGGIVGP